MTWSTIVAGDPEAWMTFDATFQILRYVKPSNQIGNTQ